MFVGVLCVCVRGVCMHVRRGEEERESTFGPGAHTYITRSGVTGHVFFFFSLYSLFLFHFYFCKTLLCLLIYFCTVFSALSIACLPLF